MNPDENDRLQRLVDTLLRQPEPADDLDARRALTRLTAARPDAAYLLLQRALVLELALARVKAQQAQQAQAVDAPPSPEAGLRQATSAAAAGAPAAGRAARASPRPSPFVRDAATIAAGVVAGGLVLGGLDALGDSLAGDGDMDLDLGLDDWL